MKTIHSFFCSLIILIILINTIPQITGYTKDSQIIYVDIDNTDGPWDGTKTYPYTHIQDAIHHASDHDIIFINQGRYKETLHIDKPLTLIGQEATNTIIDGTFSPIIIHVIANQVTINQLTIQKGGGNTQNAGILLDSSHNTISNCYIFQTKTGILSNANEHNTIQHCTFYKNGEGIRISHNTHAIIINNTFSHNGLGFHSNNSHYTEITGCMAHTNGIGYYFTDSHDFAIQQTAAYNNNDNQGGFFFESCHNITLTDCIIAHNGFGLKTSHCQQFTINHSTILYNTHAGVLIMDNSENISFMDSVFTKNLRISIYASQSSITAQRNNICNSICGVYAERAYCQFDQNWWGSSLGPSCIERQQRDNIKQTKSTVTIQRYANQEYDPCGASWEIPDLFEKQVPPIKESTQIIFEEIDIDQDGVPDWWEETYGYNPQVKDDHQILDPDDDGLTNIEECYAYTYGSDPFHKDVFWEFDWMECRTYETEENKPSQEYIKKAIDIYAAYDISLHVDVGNLDGGELIPYKANFSFADLRDHYWDYFLHNDINNPRKGIFHYGLICDYGPASGFAFMGLDNLDGFCISADILKNNHEVPYPRQRFIMGASIHELGHTLGLTVDDHGGNDNKIATLPFTLQWFKYLSYPSCMNYFYTYFILGYSNGTHGLGDFNDWSHMDFSFFKNTHFIIPENLR